MHERLYSLLVTQTFYVVLKIVANCGGGYDPSNYDFLPSKMGTNNIRGVETFSFLIRNHKYYNTW